MIRRAIWYFLAFLTACTAPGGLPQKGVTDQTPVNDRSPEQAISPTSEAKIISAERNRRVAVEQAYRFTFSLGFDSIRPIYDPQFAIVAEAPLHDEALILGIAWDGEAKAYPITVLSFREMVNDELAGIPILATW